LARLASLLVAVVLALSAYGAHSQDMRPFPAQWGPFVGAADHSALNAPLTEADRITVQGSHFSRVGADLRPGTGDDSRVRLFGINLSHDAAFPSTERAKAVARTLRSMGFNAVRLHHLDTRPTSDPQIFRGTLTTGPYPSLHSGAIERLRHFIGVLAQEGLYVNLNLMVGYTFRPDVDGIPALNAAGKAPGYASPVHSFHPKLVALQEAHARQLIAALGLKTAPSLAQVEIINESSLASAWLHWHSNVWTTEIAGPYATELNTQWQTWVLQRHGTWDKACKVWGTCGAEDKAMLTPAQADALQHGFDSGLLLKLKSRALAGLANAQSVLGVAKAVPDRPNLHPKVQDAMGFVTEVDRRFVTRMRAVVKNATHPHMPVTGTQVNFGAPLHFASHAAMDYVDAHYYQDHPEFPGEPWSDTDWRIANTSMVDGGLRDLLALAFLRDPKRPFVVSEFNQAFPNAQSHEILPLMAAVAAQQDWDGLYFFDYTDAHEDRHTPRYFNLQGNWTQASVVGLSARMFRTPSVPVLPQAHAVAIDEDAWKAYAAADRRPDTWERALHKQRGVDFVLALSHRVGHQTGRPGVTAITPDVTRLKPQALGWAPQDKKLSIDTALASGVWSPSQPGVVLQNQWLTVEAPPQVGAPTLAVLAHSLDGQPLPQSRHWLLVVPAPTVGTLPGRSPPRPQPLVPYKGDRRWWTLESAQTGHISGSRATTGPLWIQRQPVRLRLAQMAGQWVIYPLDANGKRLAALPPAQMVKLGQHWQIDLNQGVDNTALWFEVVAP